MGGLTRFIDFGRGSLFVGALIASFAGQSTLGMSGMAHAADFKWPAIGMSGADAAALLKGRCPTVWQPAPYLTCANGVQVVTATSSDKDRIYYVQRLDPTSEEKQVYADRVAAELGFDGEGTGCMRHDKPAICWARADGTKLFAAMDFNPGVLASQMINEKIEQEDNKL